MTTLPKTTNLLLEQQGPWLTIWLNRPDCRNALSKEMLNEMIKVLDLVQSDKSIRGITFRGKEGVFCAGGDIKGFKKIATAGNKAQDYAKEMSCEAGLFFQKINNCHQITVAVVEGAAIAGGLGLACATDFVILKNDVKLALTEILIGLSPAQIAPYIIQKIGIPQAKKLMLLATPLTAEEAKDIGLADFLVTDDKQITATLDEIRNRVLRAGPNAVTVTKNIINASQSMDHGQLINTAAEMFADLLVSTEGKEGFNSFLEKRKPNWAKESE